MKKYILVFTIILLGLITIVTFVNLGGLRFYIVNSGSMEPEIKKGSLILVHKGSEIKQGDAITYFSPLSESNYVTHRVSRIETMENEKIYWTKGDANNIEDESFVSQKEIFGKVLFNIPFLGYFFSFLRTTPGLTIFIVIPSTIIAYTEVLNIKKVISEKREQKA